MRYQNRNFKVQKACSTLKSTPDLISSIDQIWLMVAFLWLYTQTAQHLLYWSNLIGGNTPVRSQCVHVVRRWDFKRLSSPQWYSSLTWLVLWEITHTLYRFLQRTTFLIFSSLVGYSLMLLMPASTLPGPRSHSRGASVWHQGATVPTWQSSFFLFFLNNSVTHRPQTVCWSSLCFYRGFSGPSLYTLCQKDGNYQKRRRTRGEKGQRDVQTKGASER